MDRLDQVLDTATPLLRRVDEVLGVAGAPADHGLWQELRRVRLLPGDAAHAVAALRPAAFTDAVPELRADARACAEAAAALPGPDDWSGDAAEAYDDLRLRTAAHLSGGDDSLDERLEATADLAQALTDWMAKTRHDLATTLALVLASGEALELAAPPTVPPESGQVLAAADVATRVLHAIAESYTDAVDLLHGSRPLATPLPM
jgi:hypothetical protein